MTVVPIYSDVNQYDPSSKPLVVDSKSILQSIHNILATKPGERLFNPEFGIDLENELFEFVDDTGASEIFRVAIDRVEEYEPRITIDMELSYIVPLYDSNMYRLHLFFQINETQEEGNLSFDIGR